MPDDCDPTPTVEKPFQRVVLRFQNQFFEGFPDQEVIHLGRGNRNHIIYPDTEMAASRQHAAITFDNDQFLLTDTSSNGTHLVTDHLRKFLRRESFPLSGSGLIGLGKDPSLNDPLAIHYSIKTRRDKSQVILGRDLQDHGAVQLERTPLRLVLESPLANEMTLNEAKILTDIVVIRQLASGEPLITEHQMDAHLYAVITGALSVRAETENTTGMASLHILETGDLAGEFGFIDDVQRTATLRAVGETEVICLARERFEAVVRDHPMIGYKLMRTLVRSIRLLLTRMNIQYMDLETALRRQLRRQKKSTANSQAEDTAINI